MGTMSYFNRMKIAIAADIHVGVPGKLKDCMWALRKIRQHCIDHSIKYLIILGDLLHDREQIRIDDLNALVEFLIETDEVYHITVITFPGNHDMYLKNSWDVNSIKPLSRYLKSYHNVAQLKLGGLRFWVVPFVHYESEYMKIINKINKKHSDGDVLLTHIGVKSATLNACFLLKSWSVVDFTDSPFDRIYSGHFHIHQQVGQNVWYPGSPLAFKFDEGDSDHGFLVFDTDSRTHEFIDLWGGDDDDDAPPQLWTIDDSKLESIDRNQIKGNIIRVALSHEYTHNQLLDIRNQLSTLGARDVRWMNLASKEEKQGMEAAQTATSSASELFEKFIKGDKDGTAGLSLKLLLQFNTSIVADGDRRYSARDVE